MARVYAGWAPSQAFYREQVYLDLGHSSLEDYLITSWEGRYLQNDANNILAMVATWQAGTSATIRCMAAISRKLWTPSRPRRL